MRAKSPNKLAFNQLAIFVVLIIFTTSEVFSGVFRYASAQASVPWLVYVPKILIVCAVLRTFFLSPLYIKRIPITFAVSLFCLFLSGLVGVFYTQNLLQVGFGLFVLLPLIFGLIAEPTITCLGHRLLSFFTILWLCAAIGVIYSFFEVPPWYGFTYTLGGTELSSSRAWITYGVNRIAGFSRASYEVAEQLLFLAIPIMYLRRGVLMKIIIWISTGILITLTTSKKSVGMYIFITLLFPLLESAFTPHVIKRAVSAVLPWVVVIIGIALPVSTLFIRYSMNLNSVVSGFLFASFEDRLTRAWPEGIDLVFRHGSLLFGRGIGGIGAAQSHFEPTIYSFADNLYLYLYATFGVTAFLFIIKYTTSLVPLGVSKSPFDRIFWIWAITILMGGWSTNGIEGAFSSILIGVTFAYTLRHNAGLKSSLNSCRQVGNFGR